MTNDLAIFALKIWSNIATLFVGLCFAYMGYRLFLSNAKKNNIRAGTGKDFYSVLSDLLPGIIYLLVGIGFVCASVSKNVEYKITGTPASNAVNPAPKPVNPSESVNKLDDRPPFKFGRDR